LKFNFSLTNVYNQSNDLPFQGLRITIEKLQV